MTVVVKKTNEWGMKSNHNDSVDWIELYSNRLTLLRGADTAMYLSNSHCRQSTSTASRKLPPWVGIILTSSCASLPHGLSLGPYCSVYGRCHYSKKERKSPRCNFRANKEVIHNKRKVSSSSLITYRVLLSVD